MIRGPIFDSEEVPENLSLLEAWEITFQKWIYLANTNHRVLSFSIFKEVLELCEEPVCGLCEFARYEERLFNSDLPVCLCCPIRGKTGRDSCEGTPYWIWVHDRSVENAVEEFRYLVELFLECAERGDFNEND